MLLGPLWDMLVPRKGLPDPLWDLLVLLKELLGLKGHQAQRSVFQAPRRNHRVLQVILLAVSTLQYLSTPILGIKREQLCFASGAGKL